MPGCALLVLSAGMLAFEQAQIGFETALDSVVKRK
jgi:hypothetical protein